MDLIGKKILIIRLSSLGDILLSTPLIRTLKVDYKCDISFVVREEYKDLLTLNPHISKLYLFTRNDQLNKSIHEKLSKEKFDIIVDLQNNFRSASLRKGLMGKIFRFSKKSIRKMLLVKTKLNLLKDLPQIPVRYASSIPGIQLDNLGIELVTNRPQSFSQDSNKKYIGFAPGSRHFTKMWPVEYYISLGKKLNDKGYTVALFGGTDDKTICAQIASELKDAIELSTDNDILQTYADMQCCDAFVCNDSGMMHTASASGKPVLAIFGSTVKDFGFAPYKTKNLILENNSLSCRPCTHVGRKECPLRHFKCMLDLSPESAYEKLKTLLS